MLHNSVSQNQEYLSYFIIVEACTVYVGGKHFVLPVLIKSVFENIERLCTDHMFRQGVPIIYHSLREAILPNVQSTEFT